MRPTRAGSGLALYLLFCSLSAFASGTLDRLPDPVATALSLAGVPDSAIGVYVHDLGNDRPLLATGAGRPLNPASVMKLVTTFAALELLGPAHVWRTEAYLDGALDDGRLEGDLVLKGYGDPALTLDRFRQLLRILRDRGLREITGDVVVDRTFFAVDDHDPAAFDDQPIRPYNVGPDALLLNEKSFRLTFIPDPRTRVVSIFSEPTLPQVTLVNDLQLASAPCDSWPEDPARSGNTLHFSGLYPDACGEKTRDFSLLSPDEYLSAVFRQLWQEAGGAWSGTVRRARVPASAKPYAHTESPPVAELIREVNKHSNNVMARQMFLALGASNADMPTTIEHAQRAVREWLERRGLQSADLVIDNGSGLSRTARITAAQLGALLRAAWQSPLMPEYVASLPLVAVDGTMKKRLGDSPVAGRAHIKSGYIEAVRAIAGYLMDARGNRFVVVFLVNHPDARNTRPALDALLEWIQAGASAYCCHQDRK